MQKNHPNIPNEPDVEFVCDNPEKPIDDNVVWSYDCDYCRVKVLAAIANGDFDRMPQAEIDEIVNEFHLTETMTPDELAERRSNPRQAHKYYTPVRHD